MIYTIEKIEELLDDSNTSEAFRVILTAQLKFLKKEQS